MSNFRVNKPLSSVESIKDINVQQFADGADNHTIDKTQLDKQAKPTKSFTVPLNEYELSLLQQLAKQLDRSQRYVARKVLAKILKEELKQN